MTDTGLIPERFTVEEQNRMLLRFARRVRDGGFEAQIAVAIEANAMLVLFGDPDSPVRPRGVINA